MGKYQSRSLGWLNKLCKSKRIHCTSKDWLTMLEDLVFQVVQTVIKKLEALKM